MNRKLLATAEVKPFALEVRMQWRKLRTCPLCEGTIEKAASSASYGGNHIRRKCLRCQTRFYCRDANSTKIRIGMPRLLIETSILGKEDRAWLKLLISAKSKSTGVM